MSRIGLIIPARVRWNFWTAVKDVAERIGWKRMAAIARGKRV